MFIQQFSKFSKKMENHLKWTADSKNKTKAKSKYQKKIKMIVLKQHSNGQYIFIILKKKIKGMKTSHREKILN